MNNTNGPIGERELQKMVQTFRVNELQSLLLTANVSRFGRKQELMERAMALLRANPPPNIQNKIRELYDLIRKKYSPSGMSCPPPPPPSYGTATMGGYGVRPPTSAPQYRQSTSNTSMMQQMAKTSMVDTKSPMGASPLPREVRQLPIVRLPFFDVLDVIMHPTTLMPQTTQQRLQENYFSLNLLPYVNHFATFSEKNIEVQLRFFVLDVNREQKDDFPPQCTIRIDASNVQLPPTIPTNKPGLEPKRPSRPVDITPFCLAQIHARQAAKPLRLHISWSTEKDNLSKIWVFSISVVRRLTSDILLRRLRSKPTRSPEFARKMIAEKLSLDTDGDIRTESLRVSVTCPLGKTKVRIPGKVRVCQHLNCFDVDLFLRMNERKPTWVCPVCDKPAHFDDLLIEGYFVEVLEALRDTDDVYEIEVFKNGSWRAVSEEETPPKSEAISTPHPSSPKKSQPQCSGNPEKVASVNDAEEPDVIDLTSDTEDEGPTTSQPTQNSRPMGVVESGSQSSGSGGSCSNSPSVIVLDSPPSRPSTAPEDPVIHGPKRPCRDPPDPAHSAAPKRLLVDGTPPELPGSPAEAAGQHSNQLFRQPAPRLPYPSSAPPPFSFGSVSGPSVIHSVPGYSAAFPPPDFLRPNPYAGYPTMVPPTYADFDPETVTEDSLPHLQGVVTSEIQRFLMRIEPN